MAFGRSIGETIGKRLYEGTKYNPGSTTRQKVLPITWSGNNKNEKTGLVQRYACTSIISTAKEFKLTE